VTVPQAQDVLQIFLEGYSRCSYVDEECKGCEVTIKYYAKDLTGGRLPVASLVLTVNGKKLANLQNIASTFFEDTIYIDAACGQDITVELMATNSLGLEAYLTKTGNTTEGEIK